MGRKESNQTNKNKTSAGKFYGGFCAYAINYEGCLNMNASNFITFKMVNVSIKDYMSPLYPHHTQRKIQYSRGTKVEKMLTLALERYTAGFGMVAKVILWCIWNHCIADSIDLHNARAVNFLRQPSKNMSKYYFSFIKKVQGWKILILYNNTTSA